jgi:DNA-binding NtrC family response regulator
LRAQARKYAQHNSSVLISGNPVQACVRLPATFTIESAPQRPFVEIAVGSISEHNSAEELFGHEDGEAVRYGP